MKTNDETGQSLVSGALDRTKSIRKTAADIFAKSGLQKTQQIRKKSKFSSGFSPFFPWTLPKTLIPVQTAGSHISKQREKGSTSSRNFTKMPEVCIGWTPHTVGALLC